MGASPKAQRRAAEPLRHCDRAVAVSFHGPSVAIGPNFMRAATGPVTGRMAEIFGHLLSTGSMMVVNNGDKCVLQRGVQHVRRVSDPYRGAESGLGIWRHFFYHGPQRVHGLRFRCRCNHGRKTHGALKYLKVAVRLTAPSTIS